ncbi:MAG: DNA-directed RNA polymerase subunit K [Nitrososphaeria archaeon]|nr:DNA-directed RNA polymerase subunit K [Nitrososphaeria archaeon]NIQ32318.1 DNA-directed RNA polymerase subunit K [Nitrososphaeria archaeon]
MSKSKEKKVSYKDRIPLGPPRLTDFEVAKIIGIRAIQIGLGAPLFLEAEEESYPIKIAEKELRSNLLPLSIKRSLLGKEDYPPIPTSWLIEAEKEDLQVEV